MIVAVSTNTHSSSRTEPAGHWSPISSTPPLPTELLLIIFRHAYRESCLSVQEFPSSVASLPPTDDGGQWSLHEDPLSPSLFPYNLAYVCLSWRDIMATVPDFWTRIVVLVDSPSLSLFDLESHLKWSRELSIDVTVTRRPYVIDDSRELIRARAAINLLSPHISRCRTIDFNVLRSSSLPVVARDFHGTAPYLLRLSLKCGEDDGGYEGPFEAVEGERFSCPAAKKFAFDGRNFSQLCRNGWTSKHHLNFTELVISHFFPPGVEGLSLSDTFYFLEGTR